VDEGVLKVRIARRSVDAPVDVGVELKGLAHA
jgi:hypothetical protein